MQVRNLRGPISVQKPSAIDRQERSWLCFSGRVFMKVVAECVKVVVGMYMFI